MIRCLPAALALALLCALPACKKSPEPTAGAAAAAPARPPAAPAAPVEQDLFAGCVRDDTAYDSVELDCKVTQVMVMESEDSPAALRARMLEHVTADPRADIVTKEVTLEWNGHPVEALKLNLRDKTTNELSKVSLSAWRVHDGKTREVYCNAEVPNPELVKRCERQVAYLMENGAPPAAASAKETLEQVIGRKVELPPGCTVFPPEQPGSGRVECDVIFRLMWDPVSASSAEARATRMAAGATGDLVRMWPDVKQEFPECTIRGAEAKTCSRIHGSSGKGATYDIYVGVSMKTSPTLYLCSYAGNAKYAKDICDAVFVFKEHD